MLECLPEAEEVLDFLLARLMRDPLNVHGSHLGSGR